MPANSDFSADRKTAAPERDRLRDLALTLLDAATPASALRTQVMDIVTILTSAQTAWSPDSADMAAGETRTPQGLALSPMMASMCAGDYVRTISFLRAAHDAIAEVRARHPERPVRVLYAGCGPYAVLALPLMSVHPAIEASFTLLDIHAESIASVRSIVESLELSPSVAAYEIADAGAWPLTVDALPDVIIVEVMQSCLSAEPQVAVTRHFLRQAPQAILIPQEVRIDLVMVDPAREFDSAARSDGREPAARDRVPAGPVFTLNAETVRAWADLEQDWLPGETVRIPQPLEARYEAMLFTTVRTRGRHVLTDYDSGLTSPLHLTLEEGIRPGDVIAFHYELGPHPRLVCVICDG